MKTTTLRNGLTVLDKYYVNRKQAEKGQHKLMREYGTDSYIWNRGGRVFYVAIK
jgi:hypothetical protein|tara:strand:+ start:287 stop:448 length:162 start_codon:yes stop_codon:yes gene_type:complete